jgi:hypothetical protein
MERCLGAFNGPAGEKFVIGLRVVLAGLRCELTGARTGKTAQRQKAIARVTVPRDHPVESAKGDPPVDSGKLTRSGESAGLEKADLVHGDRLDFRKQPPKQRESLSSDDPADRTMILSKRALGRSHCHDHVPDRSEFDEERARHDI